jgi:Multidrug resistance efflux pump
MAILKVLSGKLAGLKNWFLKTSLIRKIIVIAFILSIGWFSIPRFLGTNKEQPQYQTARAEKGTLITSVSASGTVSQGSSANITTQVAGIVKEVYIADGDIVTAGQKIAVVSPDPNSQQKQVSAWAAYLSAKNTLESAKATIHTLQSDMFEANQKFINDAVARELLTDDPTYIQQNADWLAAEAKYKNQQGVIDQAQASVNSAWLSYIQLSSTITAPTAGKVSGLTLTVGSSISSSQTDSNSTGNSGQSVGTIIAESSILQAMINLTEIDVVKVKPGQKVTLTLDAFPDKTFTGKVDYRQYQWFC